jgi:hypothetical protein
MTQLRWRLAASWFLLLVPASSFSQGVIRGSVVDMATGRPVEGALVEATYKVGGLITRAVAARRADSAGAFTLRVDPGVYRLRIRRIGYVEQLTSMLTVTDSKPVQISVMVRNRAALLDTVRSLGLSFAPGEAFESRRKYSTGSFITQDDIRKKGLVDTEQALLTIQGMQIVPAMGTGNPEIRTRAFKLGGCAMPPPNRPASDRRKPTIIMNGVTAFTITEREALELSLSDIKAIEVYQSVAALPAEYSGLGNAFCGLIVFWTHRPP